ncbi:MAG: hypothetical protein F6J97_21180 [Leptolyngbya sp. SIO4C1]|nr:hypothetical protein [Leptolyngbya sp. SIO4C1]
MTTQRRPIGVTVLAILNVVGSAIMVLVGLLAIGLSGPFLEGMMEDPDFREVVEELPPGVLSAIPGLVGGFLIFFSIIGFILAYGLFTLRVWAWYMTLILQGLGAFSNLGSLLTGNFLAIISLAISALIIYYFVQPNVKRAFSV